MLNTNQSKESNLTFGYLSKVRDGQSGIEIIDRYDYSAGVSCFVSKVNLTPPDDCRLHNNPSLNCRQVPFGLIDCKKDVVEILNLVSEDINKGVKVLSDGKLVGFRDQYNNT